MKRLLSFIILLLSAAHLFAQQKNTIATHLEGLDTAFARVLKNFHVSGFAVAVINKDKVIYSKGFGYSNYETKTPVTPNTLFAIGSCTKAFTAGLLGILNKEGKVDFDTTVRTYLPTVQFYNSELNNNMTVRDMMCHRTGLPRHDVSWYFFPNNNRDSLVQRIQYMEPSAPLRYRWQYNNFMFMLQGYLAEKLTGKSWEDNIREQFFQPLGMTHSDVSLAEWTKADDIAVGYDVDKDSIIIRLPYYNIAGMAPAGSINSSVNDMAKWVITWINGGKYNGKEILPAGYVAQAISSQMVINGALPTSETPDVYLSNYGFGWFLSSYRGHYRVEHGGNIDGFSASTSFFPSDSVGIVVLCNQNGSSIPSIVRNIIADKLLGLKYTDWDTRLKAQMDTAIAAAKKAEQIKVKTNIIPAPLTHPLANYTGLFSNKGYGNIQLQLVADSLEALNTSHTVYFRHRTYDLFDVMIKGETGFDTTQLLPARFEMDNNGKIDKLAMQLQEGVQDIVFERVPEVKPIPKDSLKKYVGDYVVTPAVTAKMYIKQDSVLYLFVPGQPEYELVPTDKDKFTIKNIGGYSLQFNTNSEGKITEVLFIQPNGTFKATKKEE